MSDDRRPADVLRERAKVERRLLRAEQTAECNLLAAQERLASAQLILNKAQKRFDRRSKRVADALDTLRAAQLTRATGPDTPINGTTESNAATRSNPVEPDAAQEYEAVIARPERDDSGLPPRIVETNSVDDDEPSDPRPTRRRKRRSESTDQV